jgi:L-serine deaminase
MKRFLPVLFALILPIAGFAQSVPGPQGKMFKQLGLTDAQVSQVMDVQSKTRASMRANAVQLRLLRAQLDKALLPSTVDMPGVNALITQMGQVRVDMQKTRVATRVQLRQIMGEDSFRAYMRHVRHHMHPGMKNGRTTMGPGRFHREAMSDYGALADEAGSVQNN